MKESARYILPILVFVALVLSIGTGGYLIIEDEISVSDAFYMAVTAITPTQFDEIHELSVAGRYFTVVLVFCGFGAVVAFATQFARLIVQSELEGVGVITRKQMSRRIRQMKNHYIVCGYGEIGGAICDELKDQQLPFVVIADDETSQKEIERKGHARVKGHPTSDISLKEAGVEQAVGVIAVLSDDADNLFISLAARELNPKIFIIARVKDSSVENRILRAGADIVVSPIKLGGRQIAELIKQRAGASSLTNLAAAPTSVMGLRLSVYHHGASDTTVLSKILEDSGAVGAAGLERRDGSMESCPLPDAVVHQDDAVVLIMRVDQVAASNVKQPTGRTILLADDHRALRLLFARKLASAGHDVIQAAAGDEALRLARQHSPDLVVLDVNMPHRNGYDVCMALRRSDRFVTTPIILYSGEETEEFVKRGREAGADMCLRKTSQSSELLARIEEVFAGQLGTASALDQHDAAAVEGAVESVVAASVGAPLETPFDIDTMLEIVGGDRQLMDEVIKATLEETPRMMERIRLAVDGDDREALRLEAHSLKSSVTILGADKAVAAVAALESAGSQGNLNDVGHLVAELRTRIDDLMAALEQTDPR